MTKRIFYILDSQACKVTWRIPVVAHSASEAWEKYNKGEHGEAVGSAEIGDSIEAIQYDPGIERGGTRDDLEERCDKLDQLLNSEDKFYEFRRIQQAISEAEDALEAFDSLDAKNEIEAA